MFAHPRVREADVISSNMTLRSNASVFFALSLAGGVTPFGLWACDSETPSAVEAAQSADSIDAHDVDVVDSSETAIPLEEVNDGSDASDAAVVLGDPDVLVGSFQVRLIAPVAATADSEAEPGYTSVFGKVYDGPTPLGVVYEVAASDGDCRLVVPRVPNCLTACGGGALCVEEDTCQSYPTAHPLGTVTVSGIVTSDGARTFPLAMVANNYQPAAAIDLPLPAFSQGDPITVSATGGDFAPFTLTSTGIDALELTSDDIALAADSDLPLTWVAASPSSADVIAVKLDISHHGGTKGIIECETDDDGALAISASLVGKLLDLGVAGLPTIIVTRRATGSVTIEPGRVDLVVASVVERAVVVPGVISCTDTSQCPDDTTCQDDLTCR